MMSRNDESLQNGYGGNQMKRLLLMVALFAVSLGSAHASVIVTLTGKGADPTPGLFDWIYTASLQPGQNLRNGDFFTIYDFSSISSASFLNSLNTTGQTFTVTTPLTGENPPSTSIPDDPTITNITVKLTAGGPVVPDPTKGSVVLGTLVVRTPLDVPVDAVYGAVAQKKADLSSVSNVGFTSVPAAVPEPGSLSMVLAGLVAFAGLIVRRRTRY
jgi:hypothetical protein